MTPKEKAQELVKKFTAHSYHNDNVQQCFDHAKQCALIAVDEILNAYPHTFGLNKEYTKDGELVTSIVNIRPNIIYWQKVKQEIENL
jgi:hypothetical protein